MKKAIFLSLIFLISRWFVLENPPFIEGKNGLPSSGYSDVKQDSERYANMWHYGLTPYREHLYEYPPIAIPFVYLPLLVDLAGFGSYYQNYRIEIFLFECVLFLMILKTLDKLWPNQPVRQIVPLIFYILIGMVGKDYWYEGLDLLFIGFFTLGLMVQYLFGSNTLMKRILFWALFSASFGIKYMTAPLALPLFWLKRKQWKKELIAMMLGFLIVWGVPIALYRSSLSVMVFFHTVRPLKYGAFGTWLVWAVNDFTQTEVQTDILPHLPIIGPVAQTIEKVLGILFPLSILLSIGWGTYKIHKTKIASKTEELAICILVSLLYFMAIFLTNKVFSSPFHIWYVPLIVLLPVKSLSKQLTLMLGALWMFILDTTPLVKAPDVKLFSTVPLGRLRDFTRFIPMFFMMHFAASSLIKRGKSL